MKIYQINYSATKRIQKMRLAAETPQSWEITDISRAYHLRSSVLFLILSFLGWKYIRYIIQYLNRLQNLERLQTFRARIILGAQFFFILFFLEGNISDTLFSIQTYSTWMICARKICSLSRLRSLSCHSQLLNLIACWIMYQIYFHPKNERIKKKLSS
jgi:nitric oxide reductase large subunit